MIESGEECAKGSHRTATIASPFKELPSGCGEHLAIAALDGHLSSGRLESRVTSVNRLFILSQDETRSLRCRQVIAIEMVEGGCICAVILDHRQGTEADLWICPDHGLLLWRYIDGLVSH